MFLILFFLVLTIPLIQASPIKNFFYKTAVFFGIIKITDANHLNSDRVIISDIYEEVKELDGVWSEEIPDGDYIRVTFEKKLTSKNDITIYPRVVNGNPKIEVYEKGKDKIIAEFTNIKNNEYNKVFLTNLVGEQDTFDLRIIDGSVQFDYIVDPAPLIINSAVTLCGEVTAYTDILVNTSGILRICSKTATPGTGYVNITLGPNGNFTVYPNGTIDGIGNGSTGGVGASGTSATGKANQGMNGNNFTAGIQSAYNNTGGGGGGNRTNAGVAASGGGGAFGGNGGYGGQSATLATKGAGGASYGSIANTSLVAGSGGGGGTGDTAGRNGSAGGAGFKVNAGSNGYIRIAGLVNLTGNIGLGLNAQDSGSGGGGSGGHLILIGKRIDIDGANLSVSGGDGASPGTGTAGDDTGGGGGGGGRIVIVAQNFTNTTSGAYALGGLEGDGGSIGTAGNAGTIFYNITNYGFDNSIPIFSNFWDDNGTLLDSGFAKFNVTINSTNGTVFIQIDSTNYTVTNLTSNLFNTSVNIATGGVHNYSWVAWGNGTANLLNASSIRYYLVNSSSSCTCPSINTNWEINMADGCVISTTCNLGTGNITFTGTGTTVFSASISSRNMANPAASQTLNITSSAIVTIG